MNEFSSFSLWKKCPEVLISSENCREVHFSAEKQRRPPVNFSERREWIYEFSEASLSIFQASHQPQKHNGKLHLKKPILMPIKLWKNRLQRISFQDPHAISRILFWKRNTPHQNHQTRCTFCWSEFFVHFEPISGQLKSLFLIKL